MDKDEIRAIVDDLLNERDLRMDDLFNQLQLVTKDLELVKRIVEAQNEQPQ